MSPKNNNNKGKAEVEALLLEQLNLIRDPTTSSPPLEALHSIYEACEDSTFRDLLVTTKAIETILDATKHPSASFEFLARASGIFFLLLEENKEERSTFFIDIGGLDRSLEIMESHQSESALIWTYVGLVTVLSGSVTHEQRALIAGRIFETLVPIMELHKEQGNLFSMATEALVCAFGTGVELVSAEVKERVAQCTFDGLVMHKHHPDVKSSGRRLLTAVLGAERAKEMIELVEMHHSKHEGCNSTAVSTEVEVLIGVKLAELKQPASSTEELEALETIFNMLMHEHSEDEAVKGLMVSMNALETILDAMQRPSASARFLHRAFGVLTWLVNDSKSRSTHFIDIGGLDRTLEIMRTFESNCFLMKSYVGLHMFLLHAVTDEQRASIAGRFFETIVSVLERHYQDAGLYELACDALGFSLCTGMEPNTELFGRAVQCAFDGVVVHKHEEDAQSSGRQFLIATVGPETAMEMIDHAEMHHCEGEDCSCAA